MSAIPAAPISRCSREPALHYLDSAATSQKPRVVLDAMREYYERDNANPHRGAYALSARATDRYHAARERVARFLGASDADCLVFTRGTTESLNLVATAWGHANVREGDEIVVTALEHHANFVPWQQLALARGARFVVCPLTSDHHVDLDALRTLVGPRTKVVAFNHVSNALGTVNPVRQDRGDRARRRARSSCATARRARRTCASASTRSTWTSTRSAATRCAGRWGSADCSAAGRSSRRCRPISSAAT